MDIAVRLVEGRTLHDVSRFMGADPVFIDERIRELEREWGLERALEAKLASVGLVGLLLSITVNRRFLVVPAVAGLFLLQHALRGWAPPVSMLRALGIRTSREIHDEIIALRILRGDFLESPESPERALRAARS
jgi:hypothetical protein